MIQKMTLHRHHHDCINDSKIPKTAGNMLIMHNWEVLEIIIQFSHLEGTLECYKIGIGPQMSSMKSFLNVLLHYGHGTEYHLRTIQDIHPIDSTLSTLKKIFIPLNGNRKQETFHNGTCVYVYLCVCVYMYVYIYVCACVCSCMRVCMCTWMYLLYLYMLLTFFNGHKF